jgi:hypothetical protein
MHSNKAKFGLAFVATAVVFVVLTTVFWEFMRDTIVMPVYYLLWVGGLVLKSIPQETYLVLLILTSLIIGGSTLGTIGAPARTARHSQRRLSTGGARYMFWRRLCGHLTESPFSRERFALASGRLILSILAYQEGLDVPQVEAMVIDGTLNVPDVVKDLIQRRELDSSRPRSSALENAVARLRRLLFREEAPTDPQIDRQVDEIVAFIEHRLEITHVEDPLEPRI